MVDKIHCSARVPGELMGVRLDSAAVDLFPGYSRSRLQQWIRNGDLLVDGVSARPRDKLLGGELLELQAQAEPQGEWGAEERPLDIVFEDEHILVLIKPAGLVVHPAAGNYTGTLLNALLYHHPELETLPRAGIVHRLDKDTSGLMVVAKSLPAHANLVAQLQARSVHRHYEAVVTGVLTGPGQIEASIGRHPRQRKKMAVVEQGGKPAITHYQPLRRYSAHTHVRLKLETGRTHQIRVHMAHLGYPLVGDATYAGRFRIPRQCSEQQIEALRSFPRQALHAVQLGLVHPQTGENLHWHSELPADMQILLQTLGDSTE